VKPCPSPECERVDPTAEQTALWVALNRAQRAIYRTMDAELKANGLPPLRWYDVLWELERTQQDGLRPKEIEKSHLFEQSNLSRLLQRLVDEGLVEVLEYPDDGRGKIMKITPQGRRMRKRMWAIYGPLIHKLMSRISCSDELDRTASTLRALINKE